MAEEITIIQDSREQLGLSFEKMRGVTTVRKGLKTGDYSIENFENTWVCERKSVQDLVNTLVSGHERFLREMERIKDFEVAYILVEHTPSLVYHYCAQHGWGNKFDIIIQSLLAYAYHYRVRVRFCKDREDMARYIVTKAREFIKEKESQNERTKNV